MQAGTTRPGEPGATGNDGVVEREVETVRTRERVAGAPVDAVPTPSAITGGQRGDYLETLPERLGAVMVVVLIAIEGLLGLRFLIAAYNANPSNSFVRFIDNVSWPLARPFANVFSNRSWSHGTVEVSTLVAMGVWLLIFALVGMLITALVPRMHGGSGHPA